MEKHVNMDRNEAMGIADRYLLKTMPEKTITPERILVMYRFNEEDLSVIKTTWNVVYGSLDDNPNIDGWLCVVEVDDDTREARLLPQNE